MNPLFFKDKASLRNWFEKHSQSETALLVGYYTVKSNKKSITWSESVDVAICFGWIDGIRRSIDNESYCIRFTPRRPNSNWSDINIRKAEELTKQGLMVTAGIEAFSKRKDSNSRVYSYESGQQEALEKSMENLFSQNKQAWDYYQSETPSYRRITIRWVMTARLETTRWKRLKELIIASEAGERIKAMQYGRKM